MIGIFNQKTTRLACVCAIGMLVIIFCASCSNDRQVIYGLGELCSTDAMCDEGLTCLDGYCVNLDHLEADKDNEFPGWNTNWESESDSDFQEIQNAENDEIEENIENDEHEDDWVSEQENDPIVHCDTDQDCEDELGLHHACVNDICVKDCLADSFCKIHGWIYDCKLPDGVDQTENFYDAHAVQGTCEKREDGIDWGSHVDANKETAKLVGIYGAIQETSVTDCGYPLVNCMDIVTIQHLLYRVTQSADGVQLQAKSCNIQIKNFSADDVNPDHNVGNSSDNLSWVEVPAAYANALVLASHTGTIESGASIEEGFEFLTDRHIELQGAWPNATAMEARPEGEGGKPLPTGGNQEGAWDQDRDGNIGMTIMMNGILTGEAYKAQRLFVFHRMRIAEMKNGQVNKLWGQLYHWHEESTIDASNSSYIVNITTHMFPNRKRSFFRMIRMNDSATCEDVLALGLNETTCGSDPNLVTIDPEQNDTWLCYTPVVDPQRKSPDPWRVTPWPNHWPESWDSVETWDTTFED